MSLLIVTRVDLKEKYKKTAINALRKELIMEKNFFDGIYRIVAV